MHKPRILPTLVLAAIGVAMCVVPAYATQSAWNQYDDPIEKSLNTCVNTPKNETTVGLEGCYETAYDAYSRLLQKIYPIVLRHLDPSSRALVRVTQERWLAFRAAEQRAQQRGSWSDDRGTLVNVEIPQSNTEAVRERILELYLYWPGYATESTSFLHPWEP